MKVEDIVFSEDFPCCSAIWGYIDKPAEWENDLPFGWHLLQVVKGVGGKPVFLTVEIDNRAVGDYQIRELKHLDRPVAIPDAKKINVPYTVADNLANTQFTLRTQRGGKCE